MGDVVVTAHHGLIPVSDFADRLAHLIPAHVPVNEAFDLVEVGRQYQPAGELLHLRHIRKDAQGEGIQDNRDGGADQRDDRADQIGGFGGVAQAGTDQNGVSIGESGSEPADAIAAHCTIRGFRESDHGGFGEGDCQCGRDGSGDGHRDDARADP